jgi:4-hydroxybenzoate polyprenyltransferase
MTANVLCAVAANVLLIVSALALNTAVDIPTDRRHEERSYLASSALRLGRGRLLSMVATEMLVATMLVVLVGMRSGRWLLVGTATTIVMLQILYNLEPLRLKRRGFVGVSAFCLAVIGLPFVLSYLAGAQNLEMSVLPILLGLGVLAIGRMTWWSVPDEAADAATGMRTPTVPPGPRQWPAPSWWLG